MDAFQQACMEYTEIALEGYVSWEKNLMERGNDLSGARKCIEHILKAIIVKEKLYNIIYFDKTEFKNLVIGKKFGEPEKSGDPPVNLPFTFYPCWCLLKHAQKLDLKLLQSAKEVNRLGGKSVHGKIVINQKQVNLVKNELLTVADWFFRAQIGKDWLLDIQSKIARKKLGGFEITPNYWENVYAQWHERKEVVYKKLFIATDEDYIHPFIALANRENNGFCDDLENRIFQYNRDSAASFDTLIETAIAVKDPTLIKILGPSGLGKSTFLGKIAYRYAHQYSSTLAVYYLDFIDEFTLYELEKIISKSEKPLLVLIDNPSKYSKVLVENIEKIRKSVLLKSVVFIICDQRSNYDNKLLNTVDDDFESFFSEIYDVDFYLSRTEWTYACENFKSALKVLEPKIDSAVVESIFYRSPKLTIGERIFKALEDNKVNGQVKHKSDWRLYASSVDNPELQGYRSLFSFVALFAYFGVELPVSLFKKEYLKGIDEEGIMNFLTTHEGAILHISYKMTLQLRNSSIAQWYFKDDEHKLLGRYLFEKFLENLRRHNDRDGYYVFRNLYKAVLKDKPFNFLNGILSKESAGEILRLASMSDGNSDIDLYKIRMEICSLEVDIAKKHEWLDKIIKDNPNDKHARTKKAWMYLSSGEYEEVKKIITQLRLLNLYDAYVLKLEQELNKRLGVVTNIYSYLNDVPDSKSILIALVRNEIKLYQRGFGGDIKLCAEILQQIGYDMLNKKMKMFFSNYHKEQNEADVSINILNGIINKSPFDIPAALLLSEIYIESQNAKMAELTLTKVISHNPNQSSPYVNLAKLYRSDLFIEYENKKEARRKLDELFGNVVKNKLFFQSRQFRTEYAKWCHECFPDDKPRHKVAIDVLEGSIAMFPLHIHSRTELGRIYQQSKFFKDLVMSIKILEDAIQIDLDTKDVACRVVLANTYMEINTDASWETAKKLLEEAQRINPNNKQTYYDLIKVYEHFDDKSGIENAGNAIRRKANVSASTYTSLSEIYLENEDENEALKIVEEKLVSDSANTILLTQVAKILLRIAARKKKEGASSANENIFLEKALQYLGHEKLSGNVRAIALMINAYDMFSLDRATQNDLYQEIVSKRNKKIVELNSIEPGNIFSLLIISRIFTSYQLPRVAIVFLESVNFNSYPIEDKIKLLAQRKVAYQVFNAVENISKIDNEYKKIKGGAKTKIDNDAILDFEKINFKPKYYEVLDLWSEGVISTHLTHIMSNGQSFPLDQKHRPHKLVKPEGKVFFSTCLRENKVCARIIEPYFNKHELSNLAAFLPQELNLLSY